VGPLTVSGHMAVASWLNGHRDRRRGKEAFAASHECYELFVDKPVVRGYTRW
jgi:YHS domain-containing protein